MNARTFQLPLLAMVFLGAVWSTAGCVESRITSRPGDMCQSGEIRECTCDDGSIGSSICISENAGFGECDCDGGGTGLDTDIPTGSDSGSESQSAPDQGTGSGQETVTDSGSQTVSDEETESASGTASDSGENPQDTEVENPEVGVECDESNLCQNDLECFAGYCMDDLGSFQWGGVRDDVITAIAVDSDNNIYVAGSKREADPAATDPNDPGFQMGFVTKLRPDGTPVWSKEFGTEGTSNLVYNMAADSLDNLYVIGESRDNLDGLRVDGDPRSYMYIAKYDSSGNRQWIKQSTMVGLNGQGNVAARSNKAKGVAIDADGDPWVAGTIVNNKMFFVKFSQEDGAPGAVTEFCQSDTYSYGNDILIDPADRGIFVLGSDDSNAVLYKFSAAGVEQWKKEWKTTNENSDTPQSLVLGTDGAIYAVGHSQLEAGTDIFVTKIDKTTSSLKWITFLSQFASSDYGWDIAAHPDGGVYITGAIATDIALIRFSVEHEWHFVARPSNPGGLNLIIGASNGGPPVESGLPVGNSGDFFYDTTPAPVTGVEHGLYNKRGSSWELVAAETVISGLPRLYRESGEPAPGLGGPGDFYADDDTGYLYEKQTYSRDLIHTWSSGNGSYATDYSEQGNKLAIDSLGNIFIAAQTAGDFQQGTNSAPSNNYFDSLLLKFVP